jgi:hypothetical protein
MPMNLNNLKFKKSYLASIVAVALTLSACGGGGGGSSSPTPEPILSCQGIRRCRTVLLP